MTAQQLLTALFNAGIAISIGATFALVDFIVPLALAVEIGHRAGTPEPASELAPAHS